MKLVAVKLIARQKVEEARRRENEPSVFETRVSWIYENNSYPSSGYYAGINKTPSEICDLMQESHEIRCQHSKTARGYGKITRYKVTEWTGKFINTEWYESSSGQFDSKYGRNKQKVNRYNWSFGDTREFDFE